MPTIQKINLKNWEEEFDRMTDDEKCIPQETLLYTYKNSKGEIVFSAYPESMYEIDPESIKEFIRKLIESMQ